MTTEIYTGPVATNCRVNNVLNVGVTRQWNFRSYHIARSTIPLNTLKIGYAGIYLTTSTETNITGTQTYTAGIEYPIGVTTTPVTWSGVAPVVVEGGVDSADSDAIAVAIPEGAAFCVRTFLEGSESTAYGNFSGAFGIPYVDATNGEQARFATSGMSDQSLGTGSLTGGTAATDSLLTPYIMVAPTSRPSIAIIGDSKAAGYLDAYNGSHGNRGTIARSIGGSFAYSNYARGSETPANFVSSHTHRVAWALRHSHVICNHGYNGIIGGLTPAQVLTSLQTIKGYFSAIGFFQCTVMGKSTSTDDWATTGNQTADANITDFATLNASIRAGLVGDYFELADVEMTSRDSSIWRANGAAFAYTSDGIHETQLMNLLIQSSGAIDPLRIGGGSGGGSRMRMRSRRRKRRKSEREEMMEAIAAIRGG